MIKVKDKEYDLQPKDEALVVAIMELTGEIRRLANK